jgi:hypothetical protein
VHSYFTEVLPKARLHGRARRWVQGLTWRSEHVVNDRGDSAGRVAATLRLPSQLLVLLVETRSTRAGASGMPGRAALQDRIR